MLGIMRMGRIRLSTALAAPYQLLGVLSSIKALVYYEYRVETLNTSTRVVQAHHITANGIVQILIAINA